MGRPERIVPVDWNLRDRRSLDEVPGLDAPRLPALLMLMLPSMVKSGSSPPPALPIGDTRTLDFVGKIVWLKFKYNALGRLRKK